MPPPSPPGTTRVLPMQFQIGDRIKDETEEWQVIGRPYTTAGGKNAGPAGGPVRWRGGADLGRASAESGTSWSIRATTTLRRLIDATERRITGAGGEASGEPGDWLARARADRVQAEGEVD